MSYSLIKRSSSRVVAGALSSGRESSLRSRFVSLRIIRFDALTLVLEAAEVTDSNGKSVDLSAFTKIDVVDEHAGHDHD